MRRRKVYDKVLGPVVEKGKRLPEIKNLEGLYPETDLNVWLAQSMEKFKDELLTTQELYDKLFGGKPQDRWTASGSTRMRGKIKKFLLEKIKEGRK
ncbi:MAG: hypothetical protein A2599_02045 [Candidatus Staskawiczbacteria bacterium RIFOXYD1_FULL_39_28]|uniref:Uncharacterized protein n=1 Tax=Candidatus Staskawiczbacteria bacterium RIFOXYC1_FULL_38_18 TaxID=1802229 RepID=A0A1G2JD08_9BACT|nr:MAG: hypothetical protein A2401_02685 [Candidatus Staskawiczbacteria bacterium RIFOXYC1_FULL_38_18]OGZ91810.1 MAG: hypothetical protein A2599_02045 [Candidatus Staskawiczbacteria bacterium RIFOXYD1_FULL_39_28]